MGSSSRGSGKTIYTIALPASTLHQVFKMLEKLFGGVESTPLVSEDISIILYIFELAVCEVKFNKPTRIGLIPLLLRSFV